MSDIPYTLANLEVSSFNPRSFIADLHLNGVKVGYVMTNHFDDGIATFINDSSKFAFIDWCDSLSTHEVLEILLDNAQKEMTCTS